MYRPRGGNFNGVMTTHTHNTAPVLLIGGTGKTGRRVAERLRALGRPVRTGSRSSEIPFVWEDESTWGPRWTGSPPPM